VLEQGGALLSRLLGGALALGLALFTLAGTCQAGGVRVYSAFTQANGRRSGEGTIWTKPGRNDGQRQAAGRPLVERGRRAV